MPSSLASAALSGLPMSAGTTATAGSTEGIVAAVARSIAIVFLSGVESPILADEADIQSDETVRGGAAVE